MKATYADFISDNNAFCKRYSGNADAKAIFELLSNDENVIAMLEMVKADKAPLIACIHEIERHFDAQEESAFDLHDISVRQSVGRMIKTIIAPFGYESQNVKALPKECASKYFTFATKYRKTGVATMKVVETVIKTIVDVGQPSDPS